MWLAERRHNPEFPRGYIGGIDDAVWWSAVTVTTVGYGDKTPKSPMGRVLGIIWMFIGISLCSILTGHMATRITSLDGSVKEITGTEWFTSTTRVCSYPVVFDAWYMQGSFQAVHASSISECGDMLNRDEVDVIVMDKPLMQNYCANTDWCKNGGGVTVGQPVATPPIGLMFPEPGVGPSAQIRARINAEILSFIDSEMLSTFRDKWFTPMEYKPDGAENEIDWSYVIPALAMLGLYTLSQVVDYVRHWRIDEAIRKSQAEQEQLEVAAEAEREKHRAMHASNPAVVASRAWRHVSAFTSFVNRPTDRRTEKRERALSTRPKGPIDVLLARGDSVVSADANAEYRRLESKLDALAAHLGIAAPADVGKQSRPWASPRTDKVVPAESATETCSIDNAPFMREV